MKGYQDNFSELHRDVYFDSVNRTLKAQKMLAILRDYLACDLRQLHVLDIGCSTGFTSKYLSNHFGHVTGIDIDEKAILHAQRTHDSDALVFLVGDAMATGLASDSVDVVICAHVYEHVPCPQRMMDEIFRVLRRGGVCYFAAENRIIFREGDYRLPFLSLLPKPMAHLYVRLAGRGNHYYESLLTVSLTQKFALGVLRAAYWAFPTYIWLLRKS
jgi:2-polyprenyl-3-methyl-5-hydroxy-6-metoxy-1,4-benzoquinol methylase